jgi:hypothetical protein
VSIVLQCGWELDSDQELEYFCGRYAEGRPLSFPLFLLWSVLYALA